jgi:hypothetical protein
MKLKALFFALIAMLAFTVNAQTDYSHYLNKAMQKIDEGDCEAAQKFYNVYKEMAGNSVASIEELIADCKDTPPTTNKKYAVGDKIILDGKIYKVAYIEDGGLHGFAVCENGSGKKPSNDIIPTWAEYKLIKKANKTLKLSGRYWSTRAYNSTRHFVCGIGGFSSFDASDSDVYDILLIYRF